VRAATQWGWLIFHIQKKNSKIAAIIGAANQRIKAKTTVNSIKEIKLMFFFNKKI